MSNYALDALDSPIILEPTEEATASVIWLHGLGADGHDFEPIVPELGAEITSQVRFVFPHAPEIPVTINNGMRMRAWYDIAEMDLERRADESGVKQSADVVRALVGIEIERGIPYERIVLAGFSQGGAIVLHTGLRFRHRLAGILALSTYLPTEQSTAEESNGELRDIPIFLGHGSQDPVVSLALSHRARELMTSLGYVVETHTYPMPHSVCGEEIRDIGNWLSRTLNL